MLRRGAAVVVLLLSSSATIFLLLGIAGPYFKGIDVVELSFNGYTPLSGNAKSMAFGVLGFCSEDAFGTRTCSQPSVSYEIDATESLQMVPNWITTPLAVHILAALMSVIATIISAFAAFRKSAARATCLSTTFFLLATTFTCLALGYDIVTIVFFHEARQALNVTSDQVPIKIGSVTYMTGAASIAFLVGVFLNMCCGCVADRSEKRAYYQSLGKEFDVEGEPRVIKARHVKLQPATRNSEDDSFIPPLSARPHDSDAHEESYPLDDKRDSVFGYGAGMRDMYDEPESLVDDTVVGFDRKASMKTTTTKSTRQSSLSIYSQPSPTTETPVAVPLTPLTPPHARDVFSDRHSVFSTGPPPTYVSYVPDGHRPP